MDSGTNWEDEELIDRILEGESGTSEQNVFEHRYKTEPAFAKKMDQTRAIREAVVRMGEESRLTQIINSASRIEKKRRIRIQRLKWGSSASIAAAAAFILFLAYTPITLPVRSQEIRVVRNLEKTQQLDSLESDKKRIFGLFFEAQSYLAEGEARSAIVKLEDLNETKELRPYFREAVQWHLVVAHLKNGNAERAAHFYDLLDHPTEYRISLIDRWRAWWQLRRIRWEN